MTRSSSLPMSNNTDANFRLWIKEIHDSLIAFGWTQTTDTGQINYSTVTRPTAINTYQGYAVYKMGDSLQATCAVFMRLDYGTGSGTDKPAVKVQITIGSTDGAGTLTGNTSSQKILQGGLAATTTLTTCRTAGSSSSFRMAFWHDLSFNNAQVFIAIERDLNTSGVEVSTGVNFLAAGAISTWTSQFLETAGGTGAEESGWRAMLSSQTSQTAGGVTAVAPVRCALGPFRNPMKTVLLFAKTDFSTNSTNPVTIYGTSHTYMMFQGTAAWAINGVLALCGIAFLWE